MADILVALAHTGLRISELAALRLSDLDFERNVISIKDESTRAVRRAKREPRTTNEAQRHMQRLTFVNIADTRNDG